MATKILYTTTDVVNQLDIKRGELLKAVAGSGPKPSYMVGNNRLFTDTDVKKLDKFIKRKKK